MVNILHVRTECDSIVGLEVEENKWVETKSYAEGASAFCGGCHSDCPMYIIGKIASYADFLAAIADHKVKSEVPEPQN